MRCELPSDGFLQVLQKFFFRDFTFPKDAREKPDTNRFIRMNGDDSRAAIPMLDPKVTSTTSDNFEAERLERANEVVTSNGWKSAHTSTAIR